MGPAAATVRDRLEVGRVRFRPVPIVGDMVALRDDLATAAAVWRALRSERFDLVHAHGQKAGLVARACALAAGVPAVYTPHSFVYRTQTHRPRRFARLRYRLTLALERFLGRRSAAITGCADDERQTAVADRVAPANRVCVVTNGVAVDRDAGADPRLLAFRGEGPLCGLVAGLRDQKGLPTLLDALDLLASEGRAVRFAIVGNGPLRAEVEERVSRPSLAETTMLLPFEAPVERYLNALDVFVLPSYWEGMPIAILEAMSLGLPVVATAVNGTPEAVADGRTGLLVPPRDARRLADAICEIASDGERRTAMGNEGRATADARFTVPRMVDQMLDVYRAVASGRPLPIATRPAENVL